MQPQIHSYLAHIEGLIKRGSQLKQALAADGSSKSALASMRLWQQDCALTVNQLSGGSKAHWLARGFSEAFLVRSHQGPVIETVAPAEIAARLIGVLEQAIASLSHIGEATTAPATRRFDFVHNSELRPVLEQAYVESRHALEQGRFGDALIHSCGILETVITDALLAKGQTDLAEAPFETRIAAAENAGIIRGGCARLPSVARHYRELTNPEGELRADVTISERDARVAGQVLNVILRDLDPGR